MPFHKIVRLGLIHVAVALTLVPINGTLNRVMISELGIAATLVAVLVVLPYLFSPIQVWIGGFSDRHPLLGYRRAPYILLGLVLCVGGTALAPSAAFLIASGEGGPAPGGVLLGLAAFGMWGMGFNVATVSYLSLATDLAGEQHRARTAGVMWFMLIVSVIVAGITIGRSLDPYTPERLFRAFYATCAVALALGLIGLAGLERRGSIARTGPRRSFAEQWRSIAGNRQARHFFFYLIVLLIALLGQDVLLEPYAADVFGVPVRRTTEYTSIWGVALLVALLLAGWFTRRLGKRGAAALGGGLAGAGLVLLALSGAIHVQGLFIPGLLVFGFGSGLSTATNIALMFDMTLPGRVGAFIGAWGMADALARLAGTLLGGVVRDTITLATGSLSWGYITVFLLEALAVGVSLLMLRGIDVAAFRASAPPSVGDLAGLVGEAQGS